MFSLGRRGGGGRPNQSEYGTFGDSSPNAGVSKEQLEKSSANYPKSKEPNPNPKPSANSPLLIQAPTSSSPQTSPAPTTPPPAKSKKSALVDLAAKLITDNQEAKTKNEAKEDNTKTEFLALWSKVTGKSRSSASKHTATMKDILINLAKAAHTNPDAKTCLHKIHADLKSKNVSQKAFQQALQDLAQDQNNGWAVYYLLGLDHLSDRSPIHRRLSGIGRRDLIASTQRDGAKLQQAREAETKGQLSVYGALLLSKHTTNPRITDKSAVLPYFIQQGLTAALRLRGIFTLSEWKYCCCTVNKNSEQILSLFQAIGPSGMFPRGQARVDPRDMSKILTHLLQSGIPKNAEEIESIVANIDSTNWRNNVSRLFYKLIKSDRSISYADAIQAANVDAASNCSNFLISYLKVREQQGILFSAESLAALNMETLESAILIGVHEKLPLNTIQMLRTKRQTLQEQPEEEKEEKISKQDQMLFPEEIAVSAACSTHPERMELIQSCAGEISALQSPSSTPLVASKPSINDEIIASIIQSSSNIHAIEDLQKHFAIATTPQNIKDAFDAYIRRITQRETGSDHDDIDLIKPFLQAAIASNNVSEVARIVFAVTLKSKSSIRAQRIFEIIEQTQPKSTEAAEEKGNSPQSFNSALAEAIDQENQIWVSQTSYRKEHRWLEKLDPKTLPILWKHLPTLFMGNSQAPTESSAIYRFLESAYYNRDWKQRHLEVLKSLATIIFKNEPPLADPSWQRPLKRQLRTVAHSSPFQSMRVDTELKPDAVWEAKETSRKRRQELKSHIESLENPKTKKST